MGSGSSAIRALTPEFIDHATRVLASHMGPLAKIVVKKAQAQTALANEFMDFLVQQCADGVDKAQLLKELQKGLK